MATKSRAIRDLLVEATAAHVHQAENQQLAAELTETHRQLAESQRQLAELRASTQQFVSCLSHDFRTPLTVIQEFTSLVRDGLAGEVNGQQEAYLDIVADRADELASMADEMLDSNKLAEGTLRLWRKPCRLIEIIAPLRANLERKARVKGVRLEWAIESDLPRIYCDADKIGRVICCLVAQAIKSSKRGGAIELWSAGEGNASEVLFGVTDQGAGLSPEVTTELNESFRKAAPASTVAGHEKLSLANSLIRMNLGELTIESELGTGSTVWFSLPAANPMILGRRHLEWLDRQGLAATDMSLVEFSVAPQTSRPTASQLDVTPVIDEFLQHELAVHDIAIQAGKSRWLVLLQTSAADVNARCDDLIRNWQTALENGPAGDLPSLSSRCLGVWNLKSAHGSILRYFAAIDFGTSEAKSSPLLLIV